jgi:hypothetical protein
MLRTTNLCFSLISTRFTPFFEDEKGDSKLLGMDERSRRKQKTSVQAAWGSHSASVATLA